MALGGGTLAGIGAGTVAAVAGPIALGLGIGIWASQPVHPAPARRVTGAFAGTDATAVAMPISMEMGKFGNKIRSILTGIAIGLGDGMEEEQKKVKENRQREEQTQEEKSKPRPGGKGKPDGT